MELRQARSANMEPRARTSRVRTSGMQRRLPGINRSVSRALAILLEAARSPKPMSFVDFQRKFKVPKATLHKLLVTLEHMRFLRRDEETGKYTIGIAAMELTGGGAPRSGDVRTVLAPILQKLVGEWNETGHLCVLDSGDEVVLERVDPPQQVVRLATAIGRRHPAYAGAGGLAGLALLPEEVALEQFPMRPRGLTKNTLKTRTELQARLREVREKGYALDLEEAYLGVRCVAVAVAVPGWPIVAISFSLPLQRATLDRLRALAKPLMAAAKEAEAILAVTPRG